MSDGIDLTPADLVTAATGLSGVSGRLTSVTQNLRSTIDGAGNPWGGDQQGSLFGSIFTEVLNHVMEVMETHVEQLDYAAESLRDSADAHEQNDRAIAALFDALGTGA